MNSSVSLHKPTLKKHELRTLQFKYYLYINGRIKIEEKP